MKTFKDYLNEQLKNPEFKMEYDNLEPEYEIIKAMLTGRAELNLSQKDLADLAGTTEEIINLLETGNYNPSLDLLERIAEGLGKKLHIEFLPKSDN